MTQGHAVTQKVPVGCTLTYPISEKWNIRTGNTVANIAWIMSAELKKLQRWDLSTNTANAIFNFNPEYAPDPSMKPFTTMTEA
jgi:hypothetical protein